MRSDPSPRDAGGVGPFLTARELAALLRIKERKVYDLAAKGQVPVSRATGKLLFPRAEIEAWIADRSAAPVAASAPRPAVFLGSFDPLLEWALRESRCGLAMLFDGSRDGLVRFTAHAGVAAGLHLHEAGGWNVDTVAQQCGTAPAVLIQFAHRRRGLVYRHDLARAPRGLADLAGLRVVPRRAEAGAQVLFEALLAQAGGEGASLVPVPPAASEADAVQLVAQGAADVAFGLETLAGLYGLGFAPLITERFDLLIDRHAFFEPPLQALLAFFRSDRFRAHASTLPGYDLTDLGRVLWNGQSLSR